MLSRERKTRAVAPYDAGVAPLPVRVIFDAAAAVFVAYCVSYLANDIVDRIAMNRWLVERQIDRTTVSFHGSTARTPPLFLRLALLAVESFAIVMLSVLTLGAAAEPQRTSELNGWIYWACLAVELVVIGWAVARGYRVMKAAV